MDQKKQRLLLGAHMSVAGGYENAIIAGQSIDCSVIQIFTKSNRQWAAKPISQEAADLFKQTLQTSSIESVSAHASYLINIGSADPQLYKKSIDALIDELHRCQTLGIPYLVLHPGNHGTDTPESALSRIAAALDQVFNIFDGTTMVLLENMAGQGNTVCYTFEQLAHVRKLASPKEHIGFCFDTCHAFAAGYDFRTPETYEQLWQTVDATIGVKHVKVMHINDSKKELGSHVDRHEDIGKGLIGLQAFSLLFNDPRFFDVPKILETPRAELDDYVRNMATIRELISPKTRHLLNMD